MFGGNANINKLVFPNTVTTQYLVDIIHGKNKAFIQNIIHHIGDLYNIDIELLLENDVEIDGNENYIHFIWPNYTLDLKITNQLIQAERNEIDIVANCTYIPPWGRLFAYEYSLAMKISINIEHEITSGAPCLSWMLSTTNSAWFSCLDNGQHVHEITSTIFLAVFDATSSNHDTTDNDKVCTHLNV